MSTGSAILCINRSLLLLMLVSGVSLHTQAQVHLKQAGITVSLPNQEWKLYDEKESAKSYICVFKRTPFTDTAGHEIIPNIAVISEEVDSSMDVVTYSIRLRNKTGFNVTHTLTSTDLKCSCKNLIAYRGTYADRKGFSHTIYIIYIIKNNVGIQIVLDTTTDLFPKCDKEFRKFMKSIT